MKESVQRKIWAAYSDCRSATLVAAELGIPLDDVYRALTPMGVPAPQAGSAQPRYTIIQNGKVRFASKTKG